MANRDATDEFVTISFLPSEILILLDALDSLAVAENDRGVEHNRRLGQMLWVWVQGKLTKPLKDPKCIEGRWVAT